MPSSPGQVLERAILAAPDDLGALAAYADWLVEQGDPRGEFIQVQLALEDANRPTDERNRLRQREHELLEKHERDWLGDLAPYLLDRQDYQYCWTRGWLDSLEVPYLTVAFARVLAKYPAVSLLRRLVIRDVEEEEPDAYLPGPDVGEAPGNYPGMMPLRLSSFANLREFQFGDVLDRWPEASGAVLLSENMPRLERLYLYGLAASEANTVVQMVTLQKLRTLEIIAETDFDLDLLADNPALSRLTQLHIVVDPRVDTGIRSDGIRALLCSRHLRRLRKLLLSHCNDGDAVCRFIGRKGLPRRLKVLGLTYSGITDRGARWLARCTDLAALELLDMSNNCLTIDGIQALQETDVGDVDASNQRGGDDDPAENFDGIME
jgi:uncharacterized protein (TIGR02996 family)